MGRLNQVDTTYINQFLYTYSRSSLLDSDVTYVFNHKMGSFCIYKQQERISILCYGEFMVSAILHNIRCLSFSAVYKCRRIPSYDPKHMWRHSQASFTGSISMKIKYEQPYCRGHWPQTVASLDFRPWEHLRIHSPCLTAGSEQSLLDCTKNSLSWLALPFWLLKKKMKIYPQSTYKEESLFSPSYKHGRRA